MTELEECRASGSKALEECRDAGAKELERCREACAKEVEECRKVGAQELEECRKVGRKELEECKLASVKELEDSQAAGARRVEELELWGEAARAERGELEQEMARMRKDLAKKAKRDTLEVHVARGCRVASREDAPAAGSIAAALQRGRSRLPFLYLYVLSVLSV